MNNHADHLAELFELTLFLDSVPPCRKARITNDCGRCTPAPVAPGSRSLQGRLEDVEVFDHVVFGRGFGAHLQRLAGAAADAGARATTSSSASRQAGLRRFA